MRLAPLRWSAAAAAILLASASGSPRVTADVPLNGAIYTTDVGCTGVNVNIFGSKESVHLDGGPRSDGAQGLNDGYYYVQVTTPQGDLLGTTIGSTDETPVHVTDGEFDECYQLSAILIKASDGTPGYDDTTNSGGEYKVWVSQGGGFSGNDKRTDNFKVEADGTGDTESADLCVFKFYDANANGVWDDDEIEIAGWKIDLAGPGDYTDVVYSTWCAVVEVGDWTVTEATPIETDWLHTTPASVGLTLEDGDSENVVFGNLCLGAGGGKTIGFWSNKNGQALIGGDDLAALQALHLVGSNGSAFDPTSKAQVKAWILDATAVNMAYMLSAQLAAMEVNVLNGKVEGDALIYAPCCGNYGVDLDEDGNGDFITIADLIAAADAALAADGVTPAGDANRSYQECLKDALDDANNNQNFVQAEPCPFSFE